MKILIIDNYDSFTFNLVHYFEGENCTVTVVRNDALDLIDALKFDKIVLSPGPGLPQKSGQLMSFIKENYAKKPILGVCLGMQALGLFFGGLLYNLTEVKHGVDSTCTRVGESKLLNDLPSQFNVGRYHSWALQEPLPACLTPTLRDEIGVLMAMEHTELPIFGLQFHPESILTDAGRDIIKAFVTV